MIRSAVRLALVALLLLVAVLGRGAAAQGVIRDTEVEALLDDIARPIFRSAGLEPAAVRIFILADDRLNAFVAGGQNLILHTGLMIRTDTPEQLAGVIAHETGHIAGGHLSRLYLARDRSGIELIGSALVGLAAAVAGAPQAGLALFAGGATLAQRNILTFSRVQEQAADQAAVTYLAASRLPPQGMLEFFEILSTANLRITSEGNVFLRTHPLTRDRIAFIEGELARSPYRGNRLPEATQVAFARSRAKLHAFLRPPAQTLRLHAGDGLVDRYARAIAYYREPDLARALAAIDALIAEHSRDPYFHELKGQMLFESGRIPDAVGPYREAVRLMPGAPLLKLGLARALMEQGGSPAALRESATLLREVTRAEPLNGSAWRFLGIAEGRLGDQGASAMALAEAAVLRRDREQALLFVGRAEQHVRAGDRAWVRLQDLRRAAEQLDDDRRG
jgi:predicted Zn-dependent protease